jgi:3-oxoacyl-[acyl-carrier-protein] synthase-3
VAPNPTSQDRVAGSRSSIIIGTGSYIPGRTARGADFLANRFFAGYDRPLDPDSVPATVSKFEEITEIAERRWAGDGEVASDLAHAAAEDALSSSGTDRESLDYVIVAHNFGDVRPDNPRTDLVPTLAARVKQRLGIRSPGCVAYDLPFGCPGWLQAMIQADYFLRSGDASRALVIGAETLSRVSDPHDRDSMLYADGAGATILEGCNGGRRVGILAHATRSDTLEHASLLRMDRSYDPDFPDDRLFLKMEGHRLYEYALKTVPGVVRQSLQRAGIGLADVRKILLHQANGKMDKAIVSRLFRLEKIAEVPTDVLPMTVSSLGNSSVATLPTLLDLIAKGRMDGHHLEPGDVVVFASVGAGMNINSLVYRVPPGSPAS